MTEEPNTDQDLEEQIAKEMGEKEEEQAQELEQDDAATDDAATAPATLSQSDIEKRMAQLDKESARHAKRVAEIMGDDFALLVPSPVDWTPGFLFNVPEMLPQAEQVDALLSLLGRTDPRDLRAAPDAEVCETCNGWGVGLTGSKAQGQETKPCKDCQGNGWRTKVQPLAPVVTYDYGQNTGTAGPPPNTPFQAADRWGRPSGHPHYGLEPAQVGA